MPKKSSLQQATAAKRILEATRRMIRNAAKGHEELEFRLRRYVRIHLEHDERGKPHARKILKLEKFAEQRGLCAVCRKPIRLEEEPHLHRIVASKGYTFGNTRLVHHECHRQQQRVKGFQ